MRNKNSMIFYYKIKIKTEQGYDKNVPKTNVEQTQDNGKFYFYLYLLGIQLKEFFKKLLTYMWPMCTDM